MPSTSTTTMNFNILTSSTRRKSRDSSVTTNSASTSTSSLDETLLLTTLPLAPREDNYHLSDESRRQRLLARCQQHPAGKLDRFTARDGD